MSPLDTLLQEAAGWLSDCGMRVPETETALALKVNRTFDGGWLGFVQCDPDADVAVIWLLCVRRFGLETANLLFPQPDPTPNGDPLPILG